MRYPTVKTVSIALVTTLILGYLVSGIIPSIKSILIAAISIIGTAVMLRNRLNKPTISTHFITGTLAYGAYVGSVLIFKLTEESPVLSEELISAIIFGGITSLAFLALNKFTK